MLVMHGGLFAQDNVTLDDLRNIERNRQPPEEGLMCDLLVSVVSDSFYCSYTLSILLTYYYLSNTQ